jgi:hypothetical protein
VAQPPTRWFPVKIFPTKPVKLAMGNEILTVLTIFSARSIVQTEEEDEAGTRAGASWSQWLLEKKNSNK